MAIEHRRAQQREAQRRYRERHPERVREASRRYAKASRKNGPTEADKRFVAKWGQKVVNLSRSKRISIYEAADAYARKPSQCDICGGSADELVYDHCHSSGKHRGWLCTGCNNGLGFFRDSTYALTQAVKYLERGH